jgi:hypothetical protein
MTTHIKIALFRKFIEDNITENIETVWNESNCILKIFISVAEFDKDLVAQYIFDNFIDAQIHIPTEIWDGQEWYHVGIDKDNKIEFITIYIN